MECDQGGATAPRALRHTDLKFTSDEIADGMRRMQSSSPDSSRRSLTDRAGALASSSRWQQLFEQIAPRKFAEELAKLSPGDLIVIESDADWVPWELLAAEPDSDLLGDRFVIVRSPIIKKGDELPPNAPKAGSPTLQEALVIVGNEIEGDDLARQTFGDYAKRAKKPLKQPDWTQLQAAVKGKDIIHFVCHGRGSKLYLDYGKDAGSKLLVKQAHQLGFDPGAVVFANACGSATASPLLSSFQSFGKEFYLCGSASLHRDARAGAAGARGQVLGAVLHTFCARRIIGRGCDAAGSKSTRAQVVPPSGLASLLSLRQYLGDAALECGRLSDVGCWSLRRAKPVSSFGRPRFIPREPLVSILV